MPVYQLPCNTQRPLPAPTASSSICPVLQPLRLPHSPVCSARRSPMRPRACLPGKQARALADSTQSCTQSDSPVMRTRTLQLQADIHKYIVCSTQNRTVAGKPTTTVPNAGHHLYQLLNQQWGRVCQDTEVHGYRVPHAGANMLTVMCMALTGTGECSLASLLCCMLACGSTVQQHVRHPIRHLEEQLACKDILCVEPHSLR